MRSRRFLLTRTLLGVAATIVATNLLAGALGLRWLTPYVQTDFMVFYAYEEETRQVDAVFMGSSHSQAGILPFAVESALQEELDRDCVVWNLSYRAGTGLGAAQLMSMVFDGSQWPRVLVLEADPLFWNARLFTYNAWAGQYWRHLAPPEAVWKRLGEVPFYQTAAAIRGGLWGTEALLQLPFLFTKRPASRLRDYRENRGAMWRREDVAAAERGQLSRSHLLDQEAADPVLKATLANPELTEEDSIAGLDRAAALCREHGTELVLLNFPVMEPIMRLNEPGAYQAYLERIQAECRARDILFVDLNQPAHRGQEHFVDHDHLGPLGARWLSRTVARETLAPLLAD